ncbi:tetratricopeptide repeat protein [bacterium]|nr:tetratricopeptide repeat protein [Nanoarchaeota archaeon]MBU1627587.1 tetratricopeptide repeat protein [bacterium]
MNHKDKISIFVITGGEDQPCPTIRLLSPMKYLAREGLVEVTYFFWDGEYTDADFNHLEDRWNLADIVILQRDISLEGMFLIREMIDRCGKVFVYEIDDNLMEVPKTHPGVFWYLSYKEVIKSIISKSDAITTTTPILARHLKQLNPTIYVLPNLIDPELFLKKNSKKDKCRKVVLGYIGTPTHLSDFSPVVPAIKQVLEESDGKVIFRSIGFLPDELRNFPNVEYLAKTDYKEYAKNLRKASFDIGLGHLEDNLFNRCKSNIKFLEYGIYGIPGIWSNIAHYAETVIDGENGILVKEHNSKAWYRAIKLLIADDELRKKLSLNVKKAILDKFLLPEQVYKWYELYKSLIEGNKNKKLYENKSNDQNFLRKLLMIRKGEHEVPIRKYMDKAIKRYENVLCGHEELLSPGNLEGILFIHYRLGSFYKRQEIFRKAEEHFKTIIYLSNKMLLIEPSRRYRGGSHFHLGCIYKELGEKKEAKHHLEECLKIIPDHKKAREYLAKLLDRL